MSHKRTKHRLVPLETLYPDRPPKEKPKAVTPFYKPGKAAEIPFTPQDKSSIRYLQASTVLRNLKSLEDPLEEIENDSKFIASSMISALQVPKAIETTFNRIHGRIYDIQRQIEYQADSQDNRALLIQSNFREFAAKRKRDAILNALHRTIRRDCATVHESLLGFLLAYSKGEDHFKMLMNRHFLVRNRNALKYWRSWAQISLNDENARKIRILELQTIWLNRRVKIFVGRWKWLSYSRHSRKALQELQSRINAEAQRRLAEKAASPLSSLTQEQQAILKLPILEQLAIERELVIIDFGRLNYEKHSVSIVFRFWRRFVEFCRSANRSGNAIAREFWTKRKKRSFFQAWFSLSVGRVVVFGGYTPWRQPVNKRIEFYNNRFQTQKSVLYEWKNLVIRRKKINEFKLFAEKRFKRRCLLSFRDVALERRARLQAMVENYITILRSRCHKVFSAWHFYTVKEKVRNQPSQFLLERAKKMRAFRSKTKFFRRWNVKWLKKLSEREKEQLEEVDGFVRHWASAGREMKESMVLISQLNGKLTDELGRRKKDLLKSKATAEFMRNEQLSLGIAMENIKRELEKLHVQIGKSSMRYFVDVKPIHGHVISDIPAALAQYLQQKEAEKQRLMAQKAAMQASIGAAATSKKQVKAPPKRRKTTFTGVQNPAHVKSTTRLHVPKRTSVGPQMPIIPDDEEEEE